LRRDAHAVHAIRFKGSWQILNNRTLDIRRDSDIGHVNL
jgi:hypothetical protein